MHTDAALELLTEAPQLRRLDLGLNPLTVEGLRGLPNLAELLQDKCERILEQVCMPVQG